MKRRLAPLLNPAIPSVRRRLVALAVLGVGLPILFLAGLGIFQTSHIARFLRETTLEYGEYAARLVSNALQQEVERRANAAAESARMAAGWGGASPQFLSLLETDDPLLRDPFLTPVETVRSRLEGVMIANTPGSDVLDAPAQARPPQTQEGPGGAFGVLPEGADLGKARRRVGPGPADSTIVAVAVARADRNNLDDRIEFPAWFWRRLLASTGDTMFVLPPSAIANGSAAYL